MKNIIFIGLLFTTVAFTTHAQSISKSVIGNAGTVFENEDFGDLHFTVGEMAVALLQAEEGQTLGEGFHRLYYDLIVSTDEELPEEWSVNVFPNPTLGELILETTTPDITTAEVYNQLGQRLSQQPVGELKTVFDFSRLPVGAYYLRVIDQKGRSRSFKVMKIGR